MKLGFDVDGVLADFNTAYIAQIKAVTGRDLFPDEYIPDTWYFPEKLKYTDEEINAVWEWINSSSTFWLALQPYPDTLQVLDDLAGRVSRGDDVYFVTARPSPTAKRDTEFWLSSYGMPAPTVLMASEKALICHALELDAYIDDNHKNALAVAQSHTRSFLLDRPWNRRHQGQDEGHRINRVPTIDAFFERIGCRSSK